MSLKKQYILSGIGITFYIVYFFMFYLNLNFIVLELSIIIIGFLGYIFSLKYFKANSIIYIYSLFLLSSGFSSILINQNMTIRQLLKSFLFIGISLLIINNKINVKFTKIIFYSLSLFLLLQIALGVSAPSMNTYGSQNHISVTLIIAISFFYTALLNNKSKIAILSVILFFIINIWTTSRSAVICAFILIAGFYLIKFVKSSNIKRVYSILFFAIMFVISILFVISNTEYIANIFITFIEKGLASPRILIWETYFTGAFESIENFIFAPKIREYMYRDYENLHNSFIQMYAYFGLLFSIVNIILLAKASSFYLKNKNYMMLLLFIIICVRLFFDKLIFCDYVEPLFYYFLFYPYYASKRCFNINLNNILLYPNKKSGVEL